MAWKNWRGPEAILRAKRGSLSAVLKAAHAIAELAQAEVPHNEGTLMRSKRVYKNPDGSPEVCISFGGGKGTNHPRVPYAVRWHENSANFQKGRKRFYLKDPFVNKGPELLRKAAAEEIRRELK